MLLPTSIKATCSHKCITKYFTVIARSFLYRRSYLPQEIEPGSYPFPKRQVPEVGRKSFSERIAELVDNHVPTEFVDIGLPFTAKPLVANRSQPKPKELEAVARKRLLTIPIDAIHSTTEDTEAPLRRLSVARHFGIFQDLFGPSHFFVPSVSMDLYFVCPTTDFSQSDSLTPAEVQPIYTGNLITPSIAQTPPVVDLSAAPADYYWTLVMTCPDEPIGFDGHPPPNEYVHWMVANLKGGMSVQSGDEIIGYLPPIPYAGSGFHRYIFVLYRQDNGKLNSRDLMPQISEGDFRTERRFHTLDFYRRLESVLTPAGLGFFQSSWDESVRSCFRDVLQVSEPIFEIEWPDPRLPPQQRFPLADTWTRARRHPHGLPLIRERYGVHSDVSFDVYLDRYRDRLDLQEEIVCERLRMEGNPLDTNEPRRKRLEYPAAVPMPRNMPSWWIKRETQRRLRTGRWQYLEGHD